VLSPRPEGFAVTQRETVLLIDDHRDTSRLTVELLELDGFQVVAVVTGQEALLRCSDLGPCLILLDLGLPDMSGLELARRLRELPTCAQVPLLALSGYAHLKAEAIAAGCDGFLLKPLLPREMRHVVESHCPRRNRDEQVA
jgi:CheY-like chemotaxis protein